MIFSPVGRLGHPTPVPGDSSIPGASQFFVHHSARKERSPSPDLDCQTASRANMLTRTKSHYHERCECSVLIRPGKIKIQCAAYTYCHDVNLPTSFQASSRVTLWSHIHHWPLRVCRAQHQHATARNMILTVKGDILLLYQVLLQYVIRFGDHISFLINQFTEDLMTYIDI